jgi:hypothetical protein
VELRLGVTVAVGEAVKVPATVGLTVKWMSGFV